MEELTMPTPIDVGGSVSNILVGSVALYVAASGSTLPNVDGTMPIVWPVAWTKCGYTESGVDCSYSPSVKEIKVDEELAPVLYVLDGEKADISASLAEGTLTNLNRGISASTLTTSAADATHAALSKLKFGSGALTEVMVGFQGYSPQGLPRIGIAYRAMAQANIKLTFKRADKIIVPVTFSLLADSSKPVGERLMLIVDQTAPHT
jgi:hypothetical protein